MTLLRRDLVSLAAKSWQKPQHEIALNVGAKHSGIPRIADILSEGPHTRPRSEAEWEPAVEGCGADIAAGRILTCAAVSLQVSSASSTAHTVILHSDF